MGVSRGYGDGEGRSPIECDIDGDSAAVKLDQFADQGQPDAAAFKGPAPGVGYPVKALEESWHMLRWHAGTRVRYSQHGLTVGPAQPHGDGAGEGEFEGVGKQIENNLFPHAPIHKHRL